MKGLDWIRKILRSPEEIREREKRDILRRESEIDKDKELKAGGKKSRGDILIIDDEIDKGKELGEDVYTRLTKRVTPIKGAGTVIWEIPQGR